MIKEFPRDRDAKQKFLLEQVERIGPILQASGAKSEELGTLAPEAVAALREAGLFRLKLPATVGGAEADPITEMLVLEGLAYHDLTSGWCTMVGATGIASLGAFLPQAGLDVVFAGRPDPDRRDFRFSRPAARCASPAAFASAAAGASTAASGTPNGSSAARVVEGSEAENGGRPIVMFSALPAKDVTLYDNWGGVTGLRGTGSCDCSVENYFLPEHFSFVWDLLKPQPRRGGLSYLLPPFSYVAKEHGSVAIGAARRALDELIKIATTTRGTFRSSKLDERHVVHRQIAEADLKLRAARALLHERYGAIVGESEVAGSLPDGADIADVRAIAVHATDVAIATVTMAYHFSGDTGLHHPHVLGRLLRDLNTAGIHQVMSDTAYENHGKFRLGLPADPLA